MWNSASDSGRIRTSLPQECGEKRDAPSDAEDERDRPDVAVRRQGAVNVDGDAEQRRRDGDPPGVRRVAEVEDAGGDEEEARHRGDRTDDAGLHLAAADPAHDQLLHRTEAQRQTDENADDGHAVLLCRDMVYRVAI